MSEPYISKKQILSIIFNISVLILASILRLNINIRKVLIFYLLVISSITFVPLIRKRIKYPIIIHNLIYYSPMLLSILYIGFGKNNKCVKVSICLGLIFGILLYLSKYHDNKKFFSSNNVSILMKLSITELMIYYVLYTIPVISEELFYRKFIITTLKPDYGIISILISTVLFVHSHYINRWANIRFNIKSYLYHTVIGLIFGYIFFYTNTILGCIIGHLIFNCHEYILLYKRYKIKESTSDFFNDYE